MWYTAEYFSILFTNKQGAKEIKNKIQQYFSPSGIQFLIFNL